jgi:hypothetical protein
MITEKPKGVDVLFILRPELFPHPLQLLEMRRTSSVRTKSSKAATNAVWDLIFGSSITNGTCRMPEDIAGDFPPKAELNHYLF